MRTSIALRLGTLVFVSSGAFVLGVVPALAQEPTATPVAGVGVMAPGWGSSLLLFGAVTVTLLFAFGALALLLWYTYRMQMRFYEVSEQLGRMGRTIRVHSQTPSFGPTTMPEGALEGLPPSGAVAESLRVDGPGMIPVGALSDEFTATKADGTPATDAMWSVQPDNVALVTPPTGPRVRLVAATAGVLTLNVAAGQAQGEVAVAATSAEQGSVELPFVGQNYATMALAIIVIAAVIVLGLARILTGEGVASLLGALIGYIFGAAAARPQRRNNREGTEEAP
jgi:hypothetical protein